MRRFLLLAVVALLIGSLAPSASLAKKKKDRVPPELEAVVQRTLTGRSNFFMRNAFDTDPSGYIGRFVPADTALGEVDDAAAMQTSCSKLISYREVGGGGVMYDEYFNAATSVTASFGIPSLVSQGIDLGADVGHQGGSVVRVRYTLTRKMVAELDDPEGFAECCEGGSGRCTGLYLGEFLEGTGEVMHFSGSATGVKAGVGVKGVELGADVKDGLTWQRSIEFPNPVFFAFKTTTVPPELLQTFEPCGPWGDVLPQSNRGAYFVGLSEIVDSERTSRDQALRDARAQVIRFVGESVTTGAIEIRGTSGNIGDLRSRLQQDDFIETAAEGIAEFVKDRAWCVEEHPTPDGVKYEAKVLAFLPEKKKDEAAEVLVPEEPEQPEAGIEPRPGIEP